MSRFCSVGGKKYGNVGLLCGIFCHNLQHLVRPFGTFWVFWAFYAVLSRIKFFVIYALFWVKYFVIKLVGVKIVSFGL